MMFSAKQASNASNASLTWSLVGDRDDHGRADAPSPS